jgi:hypothetical protein
MVGVGYLSVLIERGTEDSSAPVPPSRFARLVKKYEFEMLMFPFEWTHGRVIEIRAALVVGRFNLTDREPIQLESRLSSQK